MTTTKRAYTIQEAAAEYGVSTDVLRAHIKNDNLTVKYPSSKPVIDADELVRLAAALRSLHVDPSVRRYAVRIVRATREDQAFELGASPRASLALFRTARALAAVSGRDYVLPDDVKQMAPYVLPHRLILSTQARLRGRGVDEILAEILARVPVPIEG